MFKLLLLCCFLSVPILAEIKSYENYKVYLVTPSNDDQFKLLATWRENQLIDFWDNIRYVGASTRIMVDLKAQNTFEEYLKVNNIQFAVAIENLEDVLHKERQENAYQRALRKIRSKNMGRLTSDFTYFWTLDEINSYVREVAEEFPNIVTLLDLGTSYEGRQILALKITGPNDDGTRPIIYVDSTIHAREWAAPMVTLNLISQLVEQSDQYQDMLNSVEWIIQPVVNPDGYVYSHNTDRLWRKTRRINSGSSCIGVDGNRNYDHYWETTGDSGNPCSIIYSGTAPFSEPETAIVRDIVLNNAARMKLYISAHTYGNLFMYPYSSHYLTDLLPENYLYQAEVGEVFAAAVRSVNGTSFRVGNGANILSIARGTSKDWAHSMAGIPLSYTLELTNHPSGFDIPASLLPGLLVETFTGFLALGNYIADNY